MATGTKEKPEVAAEAVDVAALQAELAEVRAASAAALEQGQQMLAAAMALVQQGGNAAPQKAAGMVTAKDAEPAPDDPRRNVPEEGFEPIVFRAKGHNHRIVRVSQNRFTTLNGEVQALGGIAYDFFPTGDFVARNSNVAAHLRGRPGFNLEFWEVGNEPHAAPDPSVIMKKATDAAFELDKDTLAKLRAQEQASHARKVVLDHISHLEAKVAGS